MRAFVTGSTGLLGSNLVFGLLNEGHSVYALVRSMAKAKAIFGEQLPQGLELVVGDLEHVSDLASTLAHCDTVFHTAAYFREYYQPGDHWPILERLNVKATRELLALAEAQGIQRFVHTSSSGTIDPQIQDESSPPNPYAEKNLYFKSKVLAEKEVKDFLSQNPTMDVMMVLPGWMMGPYDSAPTTSGQLILDILHGKIPGYFDGGTSTVDARDVARAMIATAEKGRRGERYIVGGKYLSLKALNKTIAELSGVKANSRRIPNGIILLIASLSETWAKISGNPTVMTREGISTLLEKHHLNSAKATQELGVHFRPIQETLQDEIHWYKQRGKVKVALKSAAFH
jgi:dihydroflavonol-4-reductase